MREKQLAGKVIVVTGGTGVLGCAFNKALAESGAVVGILGRNIQVARHRAAEIRDSGGEAIALIADVLDKEQLNAAMTVMLDKYGKIDGLVNGAGGNIPEAIVQTGNDIFDLNMDAL